MHQKGKLCWYQHPSDYEPLNTMNLKYVTLTPPPPSELDFSFYLSDVLTGRSYRMIAAGILYI